MGKELEIKVLGVDVLEIEKKIIEKGGIIISEEEQINTLIDSKVHPIKSYLDAYLRIRETKDLLSGEENIELTLKKNILNKELRENQEFNVVLQNKETMLEILKNLGFNDIKVGFKHRKSYSFINGRIDIDTWDKETYPNPYIEIEVKNQNDLTEIIDILGIRDENISRLSILELQKKLSNEIQ